MVEVVGVEEVFRFFLNKAEDYCEFILMEEEFLKQVNIADDSLVVTLQLLWDFSFLEHLRLKRLTLFQEVILMLRAMFRGCL